MANKGRHSKYRKVRQSGQRRGPVSSVRQGLDASSEAGSLASAGLQASGAFSSQSLSMWSYFALGLACALVLFVGLEAYQLKVTGGGIFARMGAAAAQEVSQQPDLGQEKADEANAADDADGAANTDAADKSTGADAAAESRIKDEATSSTSSAKASKGKERMRATLGVPKLNVTNPDVSGLEVVYEDGVPLSVGAAIHVASNQADYAAMVGEELQMPTLPSGCEPVSLAIVLRTLGYDIDAAEFVDDRLGAGKAAEVGFFGSPYGEGGCFPDAVVRMANEYLEEQGSHLQAHDLTGTSFEGLLELTRRGFPVLVWSTIDMAEPVFTGEMIDDRLWYMNEHCVVLFGSNESHALVSDPLEGLVERDLNDFKFLYETCGRMAAYIR